MAAGRPPPRHPGRATAASGCREPGRHGHGGRREPVEPGAGAARRRSDHHQREHPRIAHRADALLEGAAVVGGPADRQPVRPASAAQHAPPATATRAGASPRQEPQQQPRHHRPPHRTASTDRAWTEKAPLGIAGATGPEGNCYGEKMLTGDQRQARSAPTLTPARQGRSRHPFQPYTRASSARGGCGRPPCRCPWPASAFAQSPGADQYMPSPRAPVATRTRKQESTPSTPQSGTSSEDQAIDQIDQRRGLGARPKPRRPRQGEGPSGKARAERRAALRRKAKREPPPTRRTPRPWSSPRTTATVVTTGHSVSGQRAHRLGRPASCRASWCWWRCSPSPPR